MENKNHSPPLHEEPRSKQRRDPTILPSFVIGLLVRCNFLYNQIKILHAFNISDQTKDGDSARKNSLYRREGHSVSQPQASQINRRIARRRIRPREIRITSLIGLH